MCGDRIRFDLKIDADGRVSDVRFSGKGCAISQASASMLSESLKGEKLEDVARFSQERVLENVGIGISPARMKCAMLGLKVVKSAALGEIARWPDEDATATEKRTIDLTYGDASLRLAGAIALSTLAFIVWNVGTRAPIAVARDILRGFHAPRVLFAGILSAFVGFIFVAAATVLLVPAIPDLATDFAPAEIFTFVVALALEHLVGNDVRSLAGARD